MYAALSPLVTDSLIEDCGCVNSVHQEMNRIFAKGDIIKDEVLTSNRLYLYTCDNEDDEYDHFYPLIHCKNQLEFQVKSKQDAHIMLYTHPQKDDGHCYEIFIHRSSKHSTLLKDGEELIDSDPTPLLDPHMYKRFWIKWGTTANIEFGTPEHGTILSYGEADPFTFNYFGVRTYTGGCVELGEVVKAYWIFDRAVPQTGYEEHISTAFPQPILSTGLPHPTLPTAPAGPFHNYGLQPPMAPFSNYQY